MRLCFCLLETNQKSFFCQSANLFESIQNLDSLLLDTLTLKFLLFLKVHNQIRLFQ